MKRSIISLFFLLTLLPMRADGVFHCVVAQDGTGDYPTIQAAIDSAPSGSTSPYLIFIKAGTYHEHLYIPVEKHHLHLVGQGSDRVTIYDDRVSGGPNASPVDVAATLVVHATDTYLEGIGFENSWGTRHKDGPQALALYTKADRIVVNRCSMRSFQDTYRTADYVNARNYVHRCMIEGAVDFIYGQGNVFFDACTLNIVSKRGGWIVAPKHGEGTTWGYVLSNTRITAPGIPAETSVWLGRPWLHSPKAVFINTRSEVTIPAEGWFDHMSTLPSVFAEYNTMDGAGKKLSLDKRINRYFKVTEQGDTLWGRAKHLLTVEEAARYTVENVLGGNDNWKPQMMCRALPRPHVVKQGRKLTWTAVPGARGYVVEDIDRHRVVAITTNTSCILTTDKGNYRVRSVTNNGTLSE